MITVLNRSWRRLTVGHCAIGLPRHCRSGSKPFLLAGSILLTFSSLAHSRALAQESFNSTTHDTALPDAPQPAQVTSSSGANESQQTGTGIITGTVLDSDDPHRRFQTLRPV